MNSQGSMQNKVAIVTGAGQGIGAATAQRLAQEGAAVMLIGRRIEPLESVVSAIEKSGGRAIAQSCDVSDEAAVNEAVSRCIEVYGGVDCVVNNAVLMVPGMLSNHDTRAWRKNFEVSLDGALFVMRAAYDSLKARRGSVVNVSSVCGLAGSVGTAGYSAAKAAMIAMTRNAAIEWAPHIRCNIIVPGAFLTPATESVMPDEDSQKATAASIPLKRIGDPTECANAIVFLASEQASYITGQSLVVDGGRTAELNTGTATWED